MTAAIDFTDEQVQQQLLVLVPDAVRDGSIVFAGGSLVEGFGNATSDIDLIVVLPEGRDIGEHVGGVRVDETLVLTSRYGDRRVDIEIVAAQTFDRAARSLAAHDADRRRLLDIPREFLTTLNSLRIGVPLSEKARFEELRGGFPWRRLVRLIADDADRQYQATSEDAIGAIRSGDAGTAMLSSRAALGYAMDAFIAVAGHTNTRRKWRTRKLEALGETAMLARYLELEVDLSLEPGDLIGPVAAFATNSAAYLLSALGLVTTRWPQVKTRGGEGVESGVGRGADGSPSSPRRISYFRRVASGFIAVRQSPLLAVLILTSTLANLVIHVTMVALLWLLVRELDYPFLLYSIVLAVGSGGAVVGAMATTRLDSLRGMTTARLQGLSLVLYGLLLIGYGMLWPSSASSFIVACVIDFGIGFCISTYVVRNMTQQQTAVAREQRGAVSSVRSFGTALAGAVGTAVAGALIEISSARIVVLACGGALLAVACGYGGLVRRAAAPPAGAGSSDRPGVGSPTEREGRG